MKGYIIYDEKSAVSCFRSNPTSPIASSSLKTIIEFQLEDIINNPQFIIHRVSEGESINYYAAQYGTCVEANEAN